MVILTSKIFGDLTRNDPSCTSISSVTSCIRKPAQWWWRQSL